MEIPDITAELLESQGVTTAKDRALEKAGKTEGHVEEVTQIEERYEPIESDPQYATVTHTWDVKFQNGVNMEVETVSYSENPNLQPTPPVPEKSS